MSSKDVAPVHAAAERSDPLIIDKVFAFHETRERRLIERFAAQNRMTVSVGILKSFVIGLKAA